MMFLFSTSGKIGARAIRWALNEPCSHFAMCFDEKPEGYGIVFHSHLSGVGFDWFGSWYKSNRIVYALKPKQIQLSEEERIYQAVVAKFYGKSYDYKAFAEFGYYAIRQKMAGTPITPKSRFGDKDAFLCTEIAPALCEAKPSYFAETISGDLMTPYQLYLNMLGSKDLEKVPWISDK